jgi:hypothetical protein
MHVAHMQNADLVFHGTFSFHTNFP